MNATYHQIDDAERALHAQHDAQQLRERRRADDRDDELGDVGAVDASRAGIGTSVGRRRRRRAPTCEHAAPVALGFVLDA